MAMDQQGTEQAPGVGGLTAWWTPQSVGEDRFSFPDPEGTPALRTFFRSFGGLHLARSVTAAARTVEGMRPHSLHAYFLRPVPADGTLTYVVERVRDGRSFSTRRVRAVLGEQLLVETTVSFTDVTGQIAYQEPSAAGPDPEQLGDYRPFDDFFPAPLVREIDAILPFRVRLAHRSNAAQDSIPALDLWLRPVVPLPSTPTDHAAYLALLSDDASLDVVALHRPPPLPRTTSLDHTLHWHHLPLATPDDWLRFRRTSPVAAESRPLLMGAVFTRDDVRVASVTQEMLILDVPGRSV